MNFGASDPLYDYQISDFGGVDFSTLENKVDMTRSPDAVNMMMNHNGYLEKRTGYRRLYQGEDRINGIFDYTPKDADKTFYIMHEGEKLYLVDLDEDGNCKKVLLMEGLPNKKSRHFVFNDKLYILGAGYIQIAYENGGLAYGFVKDIGTKKEEEEEEEEEIEYSEGNNYNTETRFKTYTIKTNGEKNTKDFKKSSMNPLEIPSCAEEVKIEAVHVKEVDGNWHDWNLKYVEISNNGKTVQLCANKLYGDCDATVSLDTAFKFDAVRVKYYEGDKVYAPLMFINRTAIPLKATNETKDDNVGRVFSYGDHTKDTWTEEAYRNIVPLDGDMVDAANFAHSRRRVQFKIPDNDQGFICAYALYLTDKESKAIVNSIRVDGVLLHDYKYTYATHYLTSITNNKATVAKDIVDAVTLDEHGRFVLIRIKVKVDEYSGSSASETKVRDANTNVLPGSVIEVDFTVTRDAADSADDEQINDCSIFGIYGGNNDTRVFLSGNPKHKNRDYASGLYDATYFPNNMYTEVGSEAGAIVGYQKLYSNQIIVKDDATEDASQYLRSLNMDGAGNVTYTLLQGHSTYGGSCASSFKQIAGVPFYIGSGGVYTIAGTTVQNQNNTILRSLQINKRFLNENLSDAVCCRFEDNYIVATGGHIWYCDVQHGFEWFYFDSLPKITCLWPYGGRLYFGTSDGRLCVFNKREENNAYYDNLKRDYTTEGAEPVRCHWSSPISAFDNWNMLKTIANVYLSVMPHNDTSVRVYYNSSEKANERITSKNVRLFDFNDIDFASFSFDGIRQPKPFATGVKSKNIYVFGVKLENDKAQPFGIVSIGYKYKYSKYVK